MARDNGLGNGNHTRQEEAEAVVSESPGPSPQAAATAAAASAAAGRRQQRRGSPIIAGGPIVSDRPVCFSPDGTRACCSSGSTLRVFSPVTGQTLHILHGHTQRVTSVALNPSNPTQAITSSLDGSLRVWDHTDGTQIRVIEVGLPVHHMVLSAATPNTAYLLTLRQDSVCYSIWTFDLVAQKRQRQLGQVKQEAQLQVSGPGHYIGIVQHNRVWLWDVRTSKRAVLQHDRKLTALAIDPTETRVAAGDEQGKLVLWHSIAAAFPTSEIKGNAPQANGAGAVKSVMHWHAFEVTCLLFSSDGVHLFSGGMEAVLVKWQVRSGSRSFLPRLGSHLLALAHTPDPAVIAVSFADNSVRLINVATFKVEGGIQGIKPRSWAKTKDSLPAAEQLVVDPKTGCVVLSTIGALLQFYNVGVDRSEGTFEVASRNMVSLTDADGKKTPPVAKNRVAYVAFSADGSKMVTVDARPTETGAKGQAEDYSLKFFLREGGTTTFQLNTLVDDPHTDAVTALVYSPTQDMAVTTSEDGDFKVWTLQLGRDALKTREPSMRWSCRSVGFYKHMPLHAAAFSDDGSLLAIGAGEAVTIWNPHTNNQLGTLSTASGWYRTMQLAFLPKSVYLVEVAKKDASYLRVWNLTTGKVAWCCQLDVLSIATDPATPGRFAAIVPALRAHKKVTHRGAVLLFDVKNTSPIAAWQTAGDTTSLVFAPKSAVQHGADALAQAGSRLLVMNAQREFTIASTSSDDQPDGRANVSGAAVHQEDANMLKEVFGDAEPPSTQAEDVMLDVSLQGRAFKPWGSLLDAPSHVLPSLTKIFPAMVDTMLRKHSANSHEINVTLRSARVIRLGRRRRSGRGLSLFV
eukprot:jgi/Chlat1/1479/Chrsp12S02076